MRWQHVPADPGNDDAINPFGYMDHIVVDEMVGDLGMTYLNDVAVWYAENNIRSGYDIRTEGGCFKGPYAIKWRRIEIYFEEDGPLDALKDHLRTIWGPEGEQLPEGDDPRLDRIE